MTKTKTGLIADTRQTLTNMRAMLRRGNLTGWVKNRGVGHHYQRAVLNLMILEDRYGVDDPDVDRLDARLRALYHEARAARLLSDEEILKAEAEALTAADRAKNNA